MSIFKRLSDSLEKKKDELQRKAAERAAEIALERGKQAALGAVTSAKKKVEEALFGDGEPESERPAPSSRGKSKRAPASVKPKEKAPVAKERPATTTKERPRESLEAIRASAAKEKARKEAELERDVDADLAALKKRLAKK